MVFGIASKSTMEDVEAFFGGVGDVQHVRLSFKKNKSGRGSSGQAVVDFHDEARAKSFLTRAVLMRGRDGNYETWIEAPIGFLRQDGTNRPTYIRQERDRWTVRAL